MTRVLFFLTLCLSSHLAHAEPRLVGREQISYAIGHQLGLQFQDQDLDLKELMEGFEAAAGSEEKRAQKYTDAQLQTIMRAYAAKKKAARERLHQSRAETNLVRGSQFYRTYGAQEGVIQHKSGLAYRVIHQGTGPTATEKDTVLIRYTMKDTNGQILKDTTQERPMTLKVPNTIKGWNLVLKEMREGDVFEVVIPSELAYKERGAHKIIEPNQTLVFEMQLVSIEKKKAGPT